MQTITFKRHPNLSQLWLVVTPTEPLAIQPSGGYIEDYFGAGGKITLRNVETNVRQDMDFSGSTSTLLSGNMPLSTIGDGIYAFEGWIEDLAGNVTIIGSVQNPSITAVSAIDVAVRIISNLGAGAMFDVFFHNQKPVNINVEFKTTNNFEAAFTKQLYYNHGLQLTNHFETGFAKQLYYNVEFLPEVDPLLP